MPTLWDSFCRRAWPLAGAVLLLTANGCIATRGWVNDQLNPINGRLNDTDAKADRALTGLQNLHLEKRLVLDSSKPTFAFGSAALGENAKHRDRWIFRGPWGIPQLRVGVGARHRCCRIYRQRRHGRLQLRARAAASGEGRRVYSGQGRRRPDTTSRRLLWSRQAHCRQPHIEWAAE